MANRLHFINAFQQLQSDSLRQASRSQIGDDLQTSKSRYQSLWRTNPSYTQTLPEELVHRSKRQNRLSRSEARDRQRYITSNAQISKSVIFNDWKSEFLC